MQTLIDWIEATRLSRFVLDHAAWLWPASETLHFIGLTLMVGTVTAFDLRVLGLAKGIPPRAIHRLVPYALAGFGVLLATGLLFLAGTPDQYLNNVAFHWKLVLLAVSGLNIGFFYVRVYPEIRLVEAAGSASVTAKACALVSLLGMAGIMYCGRMLTFFRPVF